MATHAPPAPGPLTLPIDTACRHGLWLSVAAAVVVRLAALAAFARPLESDGLAYFTLARSLAETGLMTDQFGHHAFYSPGYPLLLAPFYAVFGASTTLAHLVNLVLAGGSAALVWRLVRALGGGRGAALLGGLAFAIWLPGVWLATDLARENLSIPLLLGYALACVGIVRGRATRTAAAVAGSLYAFGLLAGSSVVLTGAAFVVALAIALHRAPRAGLNRLAVFAGAALLVLSPWLYATDTMTGRPVLTTNTAFNLYIGNNPAATGRFVSIRETPLAPVWHARVAVLGEVATGDWLAAETSRWIATNPGRAAALAARKLALFWAPNIPDAADFAQSPKLAALRMLDVLQWLAIVAFAATALFARGFDRRLRWPLATLIGGFWLIHGAAYIIMRYRDPIVPVLIALAAIAAARLGQRARA